MKRWAWAGLIVVAIALTAVGLLRNQLPKSIQVIVIKPTEGDFVREVSGFGRVLAPVHELYFTTGGIVRRILVVEGEKVVAGQEIAELDIGRLAEKLDVEYAKLEALERALEAGRISSEADRQKLLNEQVSAKRVLTLDQILLKSGAISENQLQKDQTTVDNLVAEIDRQHAQAMSTEAQTVAQIADQKLQISELETNKSSLHLFALVAGTITALKIDVGDLIQAGSPVAELFESKPMRIESTFAQVDSMQIKIGQIARIELDADPGHPLTARVSRISAVARAESASAVVPIELVLLNGQPTPNFTATVTITTLHLEKTISVPIEALQSTGEEDYVWTVDSSTQELNKSVVRILSRNATRVALSGISAESIVVSLPSSELKDGAKVRYSLTIEDQ
jgi:RND family efflux transporter MFP subunit